LPDDVLPAYFAGENFVMFDCASPSRDCGLRPTATSYRSSERVARDRRYFVNVNAIDRQHRSRTSSIWVVDDAKPIIPGRPRPPATATNMPALGHLFTPPAAAMIPAPVLALLAAPKTIGGVLRRGIRARVSCPGAECFSEIELELGTTPLEAAEASIGPDGRKTFVLRPRGNRRALLERRTTARLQIHALVLQPSGKRTRLVRSVNVRR